MMSTTEAAELARTILDDSETDRLTDLYTLNVHEARTLANAVLNVARLARAEEYRASREFAGGAWGGASMRLGFVEDLHAALNGGNA